MLVGSPTAVPCRPANALSFDVEEYFQVSALEPHIPRARWERLPSRIEASMERLLERLDSAGAHATFFTLGWVAERHPALIRRLVAEGHELASHGYAHIRVNRQDRRAFAEDIRRTKALLEDIGGVEVRGYRAASYSLDDSTPWAHAELYAAGHGYSSSLHPIRHDHYGCPEGPRFIHRPLPDAPDFVEIPVSTLEWFGQRLPCGGGGFFRLYPYAVSRWAIARLNEVEGVPAVFYLHPWELDPGQPRQAGLSFKTRLRHELNLGRTEARLRRLLDDFCWDRMDRVFAPGCATLPESLVEC